MSVCIVTSLSDQGGWDRVASIFLKTDIICVNCRWLVNGTQTNLSNYHPAKIKSLGIIWYIVLVSHLVDLYYILAKEKKKFVHQS